MMEEKIDAHIYYEFSILKNILTEKYIRDDRKIEKMRRNLKRKLKEIKKFEENINEGLKIHEITKPKQKQSDSDIMSTCDTPRLYQKQFLISISDKKFIYQKKQKISNSYGIEIHETTINIKSFYDEEIREKLINIILREKPISNVNLNIKDSFFSLCTSRSNKLDQDHSSANEEESTCNII